MAPMLAPTKTDDLTMALFRARLRKAERCREQGNHEEAHLYECIAYDLLGDMDDRLN